MEKQNRQVDRAQALSLVPAIVIGAGPVGLYQAFQLGLLGYPSLLIDCLPQVGGQCAQLYADKPIYDIPGLPCCSGQELIDRLRQQIEPFEVQFELGQRVSLVQGLGAGQFKVQSDTGQSWRCQSLFIAAGVGAFVPRSLPLEALSELAGTCHAHEPMPEVSAAAHVVIAGGDELIMGPLRHWVAQDTASLTLLHRRNKLELSASDQAWVSQQIHSGRLHFKVAQAVGLQSTQGRLQALELAPPDANTETYPCDLLVMCLGLSPKLGPLAEWGLAMNRRQVKVNTHDFGTNVAGIYAVGDINHYPGKRKLIACGFHEATLAAYGAAERMSGAPVALEYTTASARLHQRLKV